MSRCAATVSGFVLAAATLVACDRDDEVTLDGREFVSESIEGRDLIAGTNVFIRFDGSVGASAGCNSLSADHYDIAGSKLVIPGLSMTEKGCSSPAGDLHAQDDWLRMFLEADPDFALDEPRLVLRDEAVTLVLLDREVANPDRSLQGRVWTVTGLVEDGFVGAFAIEMPGTVELDEDGNLDFETPCSAGHARYSAEDSTLTISERSAAGGDCPPDEVSPKIDAHMLEVLDDGSLTYEVDANRLTLMRGDIGLMLTTD
ncbi:MAG: META domain-containing protein [Deltaproteobacteria bacterium]|nr:META domain-containing protein [Nannocystaceae bacterium]